MKPDLSLLARVGIVAAILITTGSLLLPQRPQVRAVSAKSVEPSASGTARVLTPDTAPGIHSSEQPALPPPIEAVLPSDAPHPNAMAFGSASISPTREPQMVLSFLEFYRERFGQFPAGEDNAQFMNALRGLNPEQLAIFPFAHPRLDASGALLDAWGKPFFFHQLSRDHVEVRSAGPDGAWYTADDLLAPRRPAVPDVATP
jgi:hypothetical protein